MIWCLNLGCGRDVRRSTKDAEWTNVDIAPREGARLLDMTKIPWGFAVSSREGGGYEFIPDESFDYVLADNVLEHFTNHDFIAIINEIDRVTKTGGRVEIVVPHAMSQGAYQDPTHRMFFVPRSALYWNAYQTPFGGPAVGITANLICDPAKIEVTGDMRTEAFIRFKLTKLPRGEGR